jgi:hypothetical protein
LTFARGAGPAFVYAYLPALLLFEGVSGFELLGLPDPTPPTAAIYGILGGAILRGRPARFRPVLVDYLFGLLLVAYVISAITTEHFYTGVSIFGSLILQILAPYLIVRCTLEDRSTQRATLVVLVSCILVITFFALIESRLSPGTYARLLTYSGLRDSYADWAERRFGFFRATSSCVHPIDLGNSAALILVMIAILAVRAGVGTRGPWVRIGLAAALISWLVAFSYTPYLGMAAGLGLFLLLKVFRGARQYLVPGVLAAIAIGFVYTATLASAPLGEQPAMGGTVATSLWIRQFIIQQAWQTAAGAGPFGWGPHVQVGELRSIDNAYLAIAIERGWVALGLWLALPVALASLASRSLRSARSPAAVRAVLLGFCGTFGTSVAMFTVWLGYVYQSLFIIVVALAVNAAQAASRSSRTAARPAAPVAMRLARSA